MRTRTTSAETAASANGRNRKRRAPIRSRFGPVLFLSKWAKSQKTVIQWSGCGDRSQDVSLEHTPHSPPRARSATRPGRQKHAQSIPRFHPHPVCYLEPYPNLAALSHPVPCSTCASVPILPPHPVPHLLHHPRRHLFHQPNTHATPMSLRGGGQGRERRQRREPRPGTGAAAAAGSAARDGGGGGGGGRGKGRGWRRRRGQRQQAG